MMRKHFLFLMLLATGVFGQTPFKDFLARVNRLPVTEKNAVIDSFFNHSRFPYAEADPASPTGFVAYFVYRSAASSVVAAGDFNYWNANAPDRLQQLSGTNFWYLGKNFESEARLDYKLVLNGGTWILDPTHNQTVAGGFGPNSELAMPKYVQPEEIQLRSNIPHGRIENVTLTSQILNNSRAVKIYLPPDYDTSTRQPGLLIVHDGLEYVSLAYMDRVLDYLHDRKEIATPIAVFIPPVNRNPEYYQNQRDLFSRFIVEEVLPYVEGRYRVSKLARQRANLGASAGGHIAYYLMFKYPQIFGGGAGQSSYISPDLQTLAAAAPDMSQRFYIDVGTYDLSGFPQTNQSWRTQLNSRGFKVRYAEYYEGHSWGSWRAHVDDALRFLFPPEPATGVKEIERRPTDFILEQNAPNPWSTSNSAETKFTFSLTEPAAVSLKVMNMLGQMVWQQQWPALQAGKYELPLREKLSAGIYFYRLQTPNKILTKKMIVLP